ncbi:cell division protein ZapB [candidate division KSB1 bacterium]|nr:cell division protein ZapB [candidate division KSB1 bacterium]
MDYQQIDILEDRINQAVDLIARLKEENRHLKQQNSELRERAEESEKTLKMLQDEFQHLTNAQKETENFKEREALLKRKVEAMLSKLDTIQLSI